MQLETNYDTGETNLEEISETIRDFANGTEERMQKFQAETGETNFWHTKVTPQNKIRMIVLDECQEVFNKDGVTDRKQRELMENIQRQCERIVKKHRSMGGMAVFATQSVTNQNLPVDVRKNSALRIAFRLTEHSAEEITSVSYTHLRAHET